jgi:hypothetical protein
MGRFYGFKLHILLNDKGEIVNFLITQWNVDDREALKDKAFLDKITIVYMQIKVILEKI